jgi:hypothetical protein
MSRRSRRVECVWRRRPDRHPGHPPRPMPGRCCKRWSARSGSAVAPFAALGGTSAAGPPLLVSFGSAALQPLRQASWHIGPDAAPSVGRWQPVRQSSHRAPPRRPRRIARGTCGGIFKRWAGKPAHCFGCEEHHPSPTPSREGRGHAHPPPARGREQGSPSERISFQGTRTGARLVALDRRSSWQTFKSSSATRTWPGPSRRASVRAR